MEGVASTSRGTTGKFSNIHIDIVVKSQNSNFNL